MRQTLCLDGGLPWFHNVWYCTVWYGTVQYNTILCLDRLYDLLLFNDNLLFGLTVWYCIVTAKFTKMPLIIINIKNNLRENFNLKSLKASKIVAEENG